MAWGNATDGDPRPEASRSLINTPRSTRGWACAGALGVMFLAVTKGPVYWIRLDRAPLQGDFIDDPWVQVVFLVVSGVVAALAWPARWTLLRDRLICASFVAFLGVIGASTLWSVAPTRTMAQALMLVAGTVAALLAGACVRRIDVLTALWAAMQIGAITSIFAASRGWLSARDHNGDLAGIYFSRNSLGPVAILAAVTSVVLAAFWVARSRRVVALCFVCFLPLDAWVWFESGSLTPVVSLSMTLVVVALTGLFVPGRTQSVRRRFGVVLTTFFVVTGVAVALSLGRLSEFFDRSTTLSGRTEIWDVVFTFAKQHPVRGWGFMAVWREQVVLDALADRGRLVYEAHSGYLEVFVGAGVLGFAALLAVIATTLWRVGRRMYRQPDILAYFSYGAVVFVIVANFGETYIGANLAPWILLSVMAGQATRTVESGVLRAGGPDRAQSASLVDLTHD